MYIYVCFIYIKHTHVSPLQSHRTKPQKTLIILQKIDVFLGLYNLFFELN